MRPRRGAQESKGKQRGAKKRRAGVENEEEMKRKQQSERQRKPACEDMKRKRAHEEEQSSAARRTEAVPKRRGKFGTSVFAPGHIICGTERTSSRKMVPALN